MEHLHHHINDFSFAARQISERNITERKSNKDIVCLLQCRIEVNLQQQKIKLCAKWVGAFFETLFKIGCDDKFYI